MGTAWETAHRIRTIARGVTLYSVASILIVALSIFFVWRHTIGSLDSVGWDSWAYSDWLINYTGGFVRRGLAGEIIGWLANGQPAVRITTNLVFGLYAGFSALFLCLAFTSAGSSAAAVPLSILIPGGIADMARGNNFYFRKDILFLIVLEIVCLFYVGARRAATQRTQSFMLAALLAVVFCAGLVLPFIHEAYVLYGAPAIFILLVHLTRAFPERFYLKSLLWLYPLLPIGGFIVASVFKGNRDTAIAIWNSLAESDRLIMASSEPWKPHGQIMTIGYTFLNGVAHSADVFLQGKFWFWVFIAGSIFGVLTAFTGLLYQREEQASKAADSLSLLSLLWIGILPIFLVSSDWGRNITNVSLSYLILAYALRGEISAPILRSTTHRLLPIVSAVIRRPRISLLFAVVFCLTFTYPECCLDVGPSSRSNPFASFYPAVKRAYHAVTPGAEWVDQIKKP